MMRKPPVLMGVVLILLNIARNARTFADIIAVLKLLITVTISIGS